MPPSLSTSQLNRLGDRLRKSDVPDPEDIQALQAIVAEFLLPMQQAQARLRDLLGLEPTSRLKTLNSLIDKMKRFGTTLSRMRDIGGLRVVKSMDLHAQDRMVETIAEAFPSAKIIPRREKPNNGYRAAHVEVDIDGFTLEIQVRTQLQDEWAQTNEKLGDLFGRAFFRYDGEAPSENVRRIGALLRQISERIADHETRVAEASPREAQLVRAFPGSHPVAQEIQAMNDLRREYADMLTGMLAELAALVFQQTDELARMRKELETLQEPKK
jgi:ppGpp synthetase/RelA/SpoT-type nucleotidyltranferase